MQKADGMPSVGFPSGWQSVPLGFSGLGSARIGVYLRQSAARFVGGGELAAD